MNSRRLRAIRRRAFELFDAERLQLSVQRRALHANELGGPRYVSAEPTDLSHEIVALEGFPRLTKRKAQQFLAADAAWHRRHKRANLRWKHRRRNFSVGIAEREDHQSFDIVSELPDVSWPVVRLKHRHGVRPDPARRNPHIGCGAFQEVLDELRNVLPPFS